MVKPEKQQYKVDNILQLLIPICPFGDKKHLVANISTPKSPLAIYRLVYPRCFQGILTRVGPENVPIIAILQDIVQICKPHKTILCMNYKECIALLCSWLYMWFEMVGLGLGHVH
jgi:hypothetical protein